MLEEGQPSEAFSDSGGLAQQRQGIFSALEEVIGTQWEEEEEVAVPKPAASSGRKRGDLLD